MPSPPLPATEDRPASVVNVPLLPLSTKPAWHHDADDYPRRANMAFQSPLFKWLFIVLGLLVIDAAIEMALVSSMVYYLHHDGKGPFDVVSSASSSGGFFMSGEPANLITNQGHTTNGAGGTAVVLIGFGGLIALWWEHRSRRKTGTSTLLFTFWAFLTVLSALLSLAALIYTFVVTNQTSGQSIDTTLARSLSPTTPYPRDSWTPENWYDAVLDLSLRGDTDRSEIERNVRLMRGWRWNLIPMFLLGLALACLAVAETRRIRKGRGRYSKAPTSAPLEPYASNYGPPAEQQAVQPKSHP